ncbi:glycosyl transferase family 2 [Sulfodiicoccus acidiphilus]|uniref:Glycosyl transferase family 2 n=1 Tax=Sulfodiicoccus acidiphilus TaxID=1670455 RepID=A0A348B4B6_9CREN|nr:glycosyltransferase family 2 protein [Sulfodiicoccus acidiphilus]BBD73018.1 glycosyl transferase family 2 [Sulfodiicoccus acidiphilus]GGU04496.1 glycosyl transferase family 2 [Sulfodiicoccus acidiphilus]
MIGYIFDALGAIAAVLLLAQIWKERELFGNSGMFCCPKASVIVPVKGRDIGFRDNVRSLLSQDYPNYEVIYVTDGEDEVYQELVQLGVKSVVSSFKCDGCSGKVRAQLSGLGVAGGEVIVFADSDTFYPSNWLRTMVAPLDRYAATTTFSWPRPNKLTLRNLLRAGFWTLGFESQFVGGRFLWGGSMAFRRDFLDREAIEEMSKEWCDDCTLTRLVKERGGKIAFLGEAIPANVYDERSLLSWSTRQIVTIRKYSPRGARVFLVIGSFFSFLLIGSLLTGAWVGLIPFPLWAAKNALRARKLKSWALPGILMSVPAIFYAFALLVMKWRENKVIWRGVEYHLSIKGERP